MKILSVEQVALVAEGCSEEDKPFQLSEVDCNFERHIAEIVVADTAVGSSVLCLLVQAQSPMTATYF